LASAFRFFISPDDHDHRRFRTPSHARYLHERNTRAGAGFGTQYAKYWRANPGLTDLDIRFRVMDQYPEVRQILTIAGPNVESITKPADAVECARIANDEMAELVAKHPDRFIAACACLPMTDIEATLAEIRRAIDQLGFKGIEIFTDINGKPLDAAEFLPIFELLQAYDLPILLHRGAPTARRITALRIVRSFSSIRISAGRSSRRPRWRGWPSAASSNAFLA
jgi:predicted TIM-barrel fold metal-dependent hydrolase